MADARVAACLTAAAGGLVAVAALHDVGFRTVPNWVSLALGCDAGVLRAVRGDLPSAAWVGVAVLLGAGLCWRRGWLGGGDVKLLAASSMTVAPAQAMGLLLRIALAGGALALLYLALSRGLGRLAPRVAVPWRPGLPRRVWRAECWRIRRGAPLPYAVAIAAGVLLSLAGR